MLTTKSEITRYCSGLGPDQLVYSLKANAKLLIIFDFAKSFKQFFCHQLFFRNYLARFGSVLQILTIFALYTKKLLIMSKSLNLSLKRGVQLNLAGRACNTAVADLRVSSVAVTPDDFIGLTPKVIVKQGDHVEAGTPIIHDKIFENLSLVSPVAGTVTEVVRGERRKLERIVIQLGESVEPVTRYRFNDTDNDAVITAMQRTGLWAMMRQRPYDIVPVPGVKPRDIFVSLIDFAPLAPDMDAILDGKADLLQAGIDLLTRLTDGKVYVCRGAESKLSDFKNAENYVVTGRFPASNAGILAANIAPVNKGEVIWTLDALTLLYLGQLMTTGAPDYMTTVAVTGPEVIKPAYVRVPIGADIRSLLLNNVKNDGCHHRIISGNVLTGVAIAADGYLRFPYRQVTVIREGDDVDEFMGWASLSPSKMSESPTFLGHFLKKRLFSPDARLNGGRRAMIMSGQYEKMIPMDIMPEYLIKAILARDIERMEALGIYEVAPEDFAAAEYVDTSKLPLQQIVRQGLEYMRKELQ